MEERHGLVLIAEDEQAIADIERLYLGRAGFGVHVERDGVSALAQIRRLKPVAVILDVGLPGMDGIELCRQLRQAGDWTPVLFVTARDEEVDRVLGLELGADDYLTKPFSPSELVARVRAVLRRTSGTPAPKPLVLGQLVLDPLNRTAHTGAEAIILTATEFDLLAYLMAQPGRVFSREQLLSAVWGQASYVAGRTVDVHIAQLRAKLGGSSPIATSRGVGYSVVAPGTRHGAGEVS
ncbi:response regulator transcription factor [Pseudarthrobacter sp. N5]|uniref:response regulator transcription factor n=1 Tax=Pseudarthrobacter sp. N5 TaxID=3418416 RepID=UPI003CE6C22B